LLLSDMASGRTTYSLYQPHSTCTAGRKTKNEVFRIRIRIQSVHSSVNPDSGPRGQKLHTKISCFEVLDVLFWGLKAFPVTWTSFMEA
jgi:hypothetical protein